MVADTNLTRNFSRDEYARAIQAWSWIDFSGKTPLFASLFGDLFFEDEQGCWLLDVVAGSLTLLWDNQDIMNAALLTDDGRQRYLLADLVTAARAGGGLTRGEGQAYDFRQPSGARRRTGAGGLRRRRA